MERYLLDTNIIVFMIRGERDRISRDVLHILEEYGGCLCASSISAMELVVLHRIGRISPKRYQRAEVMIRMVEDEFSIRILPFGREHIQAMSDLEVVPKHGDPFDHAIIAHAMAERMVLVSSDHKFTAYAPQGLRFLFNER